MCSRRAISLVFQGRVVDVVSTLHRSIEREAIIPEVKGKGGDSGHIREVGWGVGVGVGRWGVLEISSMGERRCLRRTLCTTRGGTIYRPASPLGHGSLAFHL